MGRIQSNIGLITGMPIGDTVESLMAIAARPRDMLQQRTDVLQQERYAVTELAALLLSVKYVSDNLGKGDLYDRREAVSSNPSTLEAVLTGNPAKGTYQFTPLRTVQNQQLLSSGFETDSSPIGSGKLTFRFGADVRRSAPLELYGGGAGVVRGKIRVTDRSGATAEIDLSTVQTIDDVTEAINAEATINVTAACRRDGIRLIDNTGQTVSNLMVQEVGDGTTAASLGLDVIDAAAEEADGRPMLWLYEDMDLDLLGDGTGVHVNSILPDIQYQLRDGTTGQIDFSPIQQGGSTVERETTLGEIMEVINSQNPEKLKVEIAPDGDRLVVTDLSTGDGSFELTPLYASEAIEDLGLTGQSVDGVITGRRILGGTKTVLLSSTETAPPIPSIWPPPRPSRN